MITEFDIGRFSRREECAPPNEVWSEALARRRAFEQGVGELNEEHWRIIHYLREHFVQYGGLPPERELCLSNRLEARCMHRLFRGAGEARRIAGLPDL